MNSNNKQEYLAVAEQIGDQLCKESFWYDKYCNWIGPIASDSLNSSEEAMMALGPWIYNGSSGIALFLANLYKVIKKETYRTTALGAIDHALSRINKSKSSMLSFYQGKIGVSYAAAKIGHFLKEEELVNNSFSIFNDLIKYPPKSNSIDIISGNAGAILALIDIYKHNFHEDPLLEYAFQLGNELLSIAVRDKYGWSWRTFNNDIVGPLRIVRNLTGLAHGASGIGISLLGLYEYSHESIYLEGAKKAFDYENYWFNKSKNNWPDFRVHNIPQKEISKEFHYSTSWCHGAPGIGLARLRAYQSQRDETYKNDLERAIKTTIKVAKKEMNTFTENNYSLCHGLGGVCELLLRSDKFFKKSIHRSIIENVALEGIQNHLYGNTPWPCGIPKKQTPDLMQGTAGIGYFYLRLFDYDNIQSILMPLN